MKSSTRRLSRLLVAISVVLGSAAAVPACTNPEVIATLGLDPDGSEGESTENASSMPDVPETAETTDSDTTLGTTTEATDSDTAETTESAETTETTDTETTEMSEVTETDTTGDNGLTCPLPGEVDCLGSCVPVGTGSRTAYSNTETESVTTEIVGQSFTAVQTGWLSRVLLRGVTGVTSMTGGTFSVHEGGLCGAPTATKSQNTRRADPNGHDGHVHIGTCPCTRAHNGIMHYQLLTG